jgi:ABC-type nitrate/sulfonate/bicarbonate transport system ATPase subunit
MTLAAARHVAFDRAHGPVLRDVSLAVAQGERIALVGENGAGKSSLLRLLAGLERPTRGEVQAAPRGSGYVPQAVADSLFPWRSVLQNAAMPRLVAGLADALEVAREHLRRVAPGLSPDRRAGALSGGEKQALAIARALTAPGPLVLADEPFSSLAPEARVAVRLEVASALGARALILVTHDVADAEALGARVFILADGALTSRGVP